MKNVFLTMVILFAGCAALRDLPIDDATKIQAAVLAGCTAAASNGCLDDEDVTQLLGPVSTSEQCVDAVMTAITEKRITVDVAKLGADVLTCEAFLKAIN